MKKVFNIVGGLFAIPLFLHGLYLAGVLAIWPLLDMDRTILFQKIEMADRGEPADLILLGDSSCLMDVDARALPGLRAQNFGTLSHLSLASHARLLDRYLAHARDEPPRTLVLLHPDALRREESVPAVESAYAAMLHDRVCPEGFGLRARVEDVLGITIFRQALQARILPVPLTLGQGQRYGFTSVLRDELFRNNGSLTATGQYVWAAGQGRAVYRVAKAIQRESAQFTTKVPLAIAITPIPASFTPVDYPEEAQRLLREWAASFPRPVDTLALPATLPDELFADRLHLNAEGQRVFTKELAKSLCNLR